MCEWNAVYGEKSILFDSVSYIAWIAHYVWTELPRDIHSNGLYSTLVCLSVLPIIMWTQFQLPKRKANKVCIKCWLKVENNSIEAIYLQFNSIGARKQCFIYKILIRGQTAAKQGSVGRMQWYFFVCFGSREPLCLLCLSVYNMYQN